MRKIIGFLFTVIVMIGILLVYFNIDVITDYTIKFFTEEKEVIVPEENHFKREYDYEKFDIIDDYKPLNKQNLEEIYFNVFNNGWDTFTFYCTDEYLSCLDDVRDMSNDDVLLSQINNYVSPYNSFVYLDTSISEYGQVTLTIHKNYSEEEIKEVDTFITNVLNDLNIDSIESDRDKIKTIMNYLVNHISYDNNFVEGQENNPSSKATGALINQTSVCSGYSDAMALFLDKLKIPNLKVSSEAHIWNLVYIDNEWRHLDVTWTDTDSEIDLGEKFFLITTEELLSIDTEDHNFDSVFFMETN